MMTVDDSVEVEMEEHTVHTVHTIDGVMHHEPKHQFVFISETEGVYLTKEWLWILNLKVYNKTKTKV